MAAAHRNFAVTALLVVVLAAAAAAVLPSAAWVLGLAAVLGLAGVVLLRGNGWRSGSLLISALALGLVLVDGVAGIFAPRAHGAGLVQTHEPSDWTLAEPVLGYRARPNVVVKATSTYDGKPVYRVTYTIDATGARATPPAPAGADTYLFMGDSFVFGEGLDDDQALASQFARERGFKVRAVNLGFSGYAANHLVRAVEAGELDRFGGGKVKAVVTWIIPDHLRRITGDAGWLAHAPRYVLEDGVPRHTGSFSEHRWRDPLAGVLHFAGEQLPFIKAIGARQREQRQADLMVVLVLRLQTLARDKLGAPLVVIYSWPNLKKGERPPLMERLAAAGVLTMDTVDVTGGLHAEQLEIPHDGHPSAFQIGLIATELSRRLEGNRR